LPPQRLHDWINRRDHSLEGIGTNPRTGYVLDGAHPDGISSALSQSDQSDTALDLSQAVSFGQRQVRGDGCRKTRRYGATTLP